jgi:hypothetical protein
MSFSDIHRRRSRVGKRLRRLACLGVVVVLGSGFFYTHVLSERDREAVRGAVESAKALYEEIAARVEPHAARPGEQVVDDHHNQEVTQMQWESLGY